jgi:hypothetical protein
MTDSPLVTRIYIEGGSYLRASESIYDVAMRIEDARREDGWASITDPGTDLEKLVRVERVLWLEQEDLA